MTVAETAPANWYQRIFQGPAGAVLLVALVFCTYAYSMSFSYIWDDDTYVAANYLLRSFDGLSRIWVDIGATPQYYPMTFTSFWIEYQLVGLNPAVSHGVNIALHAVCALLLWDILRRLAVPGAWLAAALFAVHPINVESVAWITERKNVLSLAFGLAALWVYLRYIGLIAPPDKPAPKPRRTDDEEDDEGEGVQLDLPTDPRRLYLLFMVLLVCGLLAKTTVAVLPGVIGVILWWKRGRLTLADLKPLVAPIVVGAVLASITAWLERNPYQIGATGPEWSQSPLERVALAGQVSWFYAGKVALPHPFAWGVPEGWSVGNREALPWTVLDVAPAARAWLPSPLMFNYPRWELDASSPLQWLGVMGVLAVVASLWLTRHRIGRGPLACVLIYLGCLTPAMGFANVYPMRFSWVADHFAYVGAIGLFVLAGSGAALLLRRMSEATRPLVGLSGGAVVLGLLMFVSIVHSQSFRDLRTLWENTLYRNPTSWLAATNLGTSFYAQGRSEYERLSAENPVAASAALYNGIARAVDWVRYAERLNPNGQEIQLQLAELARASKREDLDAAIAHAERALELADRANDQKFRLDALQMLADLYSRKGAYEKVEQALLQMQSLEPKLARIRPVPLGRARLKYVELLKRQIDDPYHPDERGRRALAEALEQLARAQEILPAGPTAQVMIAQRLVELGQLAAAAEQLAPALQAEPNDPQGQYVAALLALRLAEQYPPGSKQRTDNLNISGAQLSKLIISYPSLVDARMTLIDVLWELGRRQDAINELRDVLKISPGHREAERKLAELQDATTQPTTSPTNAPASPATAPPSP